VTPGIQISVGSLGFAQPTVRVAPTPKVASGCLSCDSPRRLRTRQGLLNDDPHSLLTKLLLMLLSWKSFRPTSLNHEYWAEGVHLFEPIP
jgi:hypothetical protein